MFTPSAGPAPRFSQHQLGGGVRRTVGEAGLGVVALGELGLAGANVVVADAGLRGDLEVYAAGLGAALLGRLLQSQCRPVLGNGDHLAGDRGPALGNDAGDDDLGGAILRVRFEPDLGGQALDERWPTVAGKVVAI